MSNKKFHSDFLENLSMKISGWSSSSFGFAAAGGIVILWALAGPILHFSEPWQLFINSVTTIITFLMVFLIQRAEQKNAQALHLKLNKIMERLDIDDRMLDIENSREETLDSLEEANQRKALRAELRQERKGQLVRNVAS
jgi:low affinity Fe/Cu permease